MQDQEYTYVKREIKSLVGVDLDCYKAPQVQRRLRIFLLRSGHQTWPDFFKGIRGDRDSLARLRDYLTINVSSFFRDEKKYEQLQTTILPELLKKRRQLRIWSAGCSRGQEPYTLAIALAEMTGPRTRHRILASDLDESALAIAKAGGPYTDDDVAGVGRLLNRYFEKREDGTYCKPSLRERVTFRQQNLLADRFDADLDLIVCRNVVIYFTAEVKDRLYRQFHQALRPGGILFVGGTELVPKAREIGYESAGISFYRRRAV